MIIKLLRKKQWQAATVDFFAKLCIECEADPSNNAKKGVGLDRSNMDFDVHPRGACLRLRFNDALFFRQNFTHLHIIPLATIMRFYHSCLFIFHIIRRQLLLILQWFMDEEQSNSQWVSQLEYLSQSPCEKPRRLQDHSIRIGG